jgi:hypothetical protein
MKQAHQNAQYLINIAKEKGIIDMRLNAISKQQAQIEIERNMFKYVSQKELGFCLVDDYQKLIAIKQAYCKLKNIPYSMTDRRNINQEDAIRWINQFSRKVV